MKPTQDKYFKEIEKTYQTKLEAVLKEKGLTGGYLGAEGSTERNRLRSEAFHAAQNHASAIAGTVARVSQSLGGDYGKQVQSLLISAQGDRAKTERIIQDAVARSYLVEKGADAGQVKEMAGGDVVSEFTKGTPALPADPDAVPTATSPPVGTRLEGADPLARLNEQVRQTVVYGAKLRKEETVYIEKQQKKKTKEEALLRRTEQQKQLADKTEAESRAREERMAYRPPPTTDEVGLSVFQQIFETQTNSPATERSPRETVSRELTSSRQIDPTFRGHSPSTLTSSRQIDPTFRGHSPSTLTSSRGLNLAESNRQNNSEPSSGIVSVRSGGSARGSGLEELTARVSVLEKKTRNLSDL